MDKGKEKENDKKRRADEYKKRVKEILSLLMAGKYEEDEENKSPAFQLYVQDFLVGSMQMSGAAVGAYILLLSMQWDKNGIPDDPEKMKQIGRCDMQDLQEILDKFVRCVDGKMRNKRLEKIRAEQIVNREGKSRAGIIGNEVRWGKSQSEEPAITEHRSSPSSSSIINKQKAGELFYIGTTSFRTPLSEYIQENLNISTEQWHMKNIKTASVAEVLKRMDTECIGKAFTDEEHISNTYKQIAKDMKKKGGQKFSREDCPYTDDQLRQADAQKGGGFGTPSWFDKKWEFLLNN